MIWNTVGSIGDEELARLSHPYTLPRPPMSRPMRAAQFAPFAALSGYETSIREAGEIWNAEFERRFGVREEKEI